MAATQFEKGLENIRRAIDTALSERGVTGAIVGSNLAPNAEPQPIEFSVTVAGKPALQKFSREEIEDSGQAIDHNAAMHVRNLVSQFVR